jgi:hydroxymethylpyrimidine pyrophosphatase-like HAD family hydrolase
VAGPFRAVAVDYDGTLTVGSRPEAAVLAAVSAVRSHGIKVILVTGRRMADLRHVLPEADDCFDAIVAENGCVLVRGGTARSLAPTVDPVLEDALTRRGVPVQAGEVLLACDGVHAVTVLEEIQRLGLDAQLVRNRAALMNLPAGVGKESGVQEALAELRVSPHAAVAIGDAENDHGLFRSCELGVAVSNAIESLKAQADVVLDTPDGAGVAEFLRGPILAGDQRVLPRRRKLVVGAYDDGTAALIPSSQVNVLIAGGSGRGKSSAAGLLVEQLARGGYSVLMVDPEGDHAGLADIPDVLTVGGPGGLPQVRQLVALLRRWRGSVVLDLSGVDDDAYLSTLMGGVARSRAAVGSPQWLVLDEAHRILTDPAAWPALANGLGTCLISWRPGDLEPQALATVDVALVFPDDDEYGANATLGALIASIGGVTPDVPGPLPLGPRRAAGPGPRRRLRHRRGPPPQPTRRPPRRPRRSGPDPTGAAAGGRGPLPAAVGVMTGPRSLVRSPFGGAK